MNTFRYIAEYDDFAESPRDWDNLGTMVCWHNRYTLGDEQPPFDPAEYRLRLIKDDVIIDMMTANYVETWDDVLDMMRLYLKNCIHNARMGYIRRSEVTTELAHYKHARAKSHKHNTPMDYARELFDSKYIHLPLYLYDHGGVCMSTGGFSCPWDSGQVGFIYTPIDKALEWVGHKERTTDTDKRTHATFVAEVETYSQFLEGQVYRITIEQAGDSNINDSDSCGGFFGSDPDTNGMIGNFDSMHNDGIRKAMSNIGELVEVEIPSEAED